MAEQIAYKAPEIAVIGGGTGSFTLLDKLKDFPVNLSSLINMSDSGGSTGRLVDEMGVLPPGDVRQALAALSESPDFRDLMNYRYGEDDPGWLQGHSFGNILLSTLEKQHKTFARAIAAANRILRIRGQVIPVTLQKHQLVLTTKRGQVKGEHLIGQTEINDPTAEISHEPSALVSRDAKAAIAKSDLIVVAPGNVYGSLLPALAVGGMREALASRKGKLVVVSNLVTKPNHTNGWHVVDYVKQYERYIGEGAVDAVLYNNEPPSDDLLNKYAADGEFPVAADEDRFAEIAARAIGGAYVAGTIFEQDPNDKAIARTLIRHDAKAIGNSLMRLYYE